MQRTGVRVEPKPGKYAEASALIEREVRRLVQHGVLESELQREIAETRTGYRRRSRALARVRPPLSPISRTGGE
jgi:hypothetical protein